MVENKPKLGYIGIGLMGQPMTLRLLAAGFEVVVWGRNPAKLTKVVEHGAVVVESAAAVARAAEITFLCLSDTEAVESVCFAEADAGLIAGLSQGKTVIDCSSIRPDATRGIAARIKTETGADWIDAPVSGGVVGAEQGTLAIMAGGETAPIERVRPVIMHLCQRFTHMGASGSGQTAKLCNQIIVGNTLATIAEVINFAERAGLDASCLPEAFSGGFADSLPLQIFGARMAAREFEPVTGHVKTIQKDLDTATASAKQHQASLPMATTAAELIRLYGAERGEQDMSSLINLYADNSRNH